ncbi:MAG: hypothetical protein KDD25_00715 [Bdellovibrionales bacterium]|nr:hypothetical protein [Bdellovibrionales bacterium]
MNASTMVWNLFVVFALVVSCGPKHKKFKGSSDSDTQKKSGEAKNSSLPPGQVIQTSEQDSSDDEESGNSLVASSNENQASDENSSSPIIPKENPHMSPAKPATARESVLGPTPQNPSPIESTHLTVTSSDEISAYKDRVQSQLNENLHHQLEQINLNQMLIKQTQLIDFECGEYDPTKDSACFESLSSLAEAYEKNLIQDNPVVSPLRRVVLWTSKTDIFTPLSMGAILRAQIGKTPEQWAELINGYISGSARGVVKERIERFAETSTELERRLGVPILLGENKEGIWGFREYKTISIEEQERGYELLKRVIKEYDRLGQPEIPVLEDSVVEAVVLNRKSSEIYETRGQWAISIGVNDDVNAVISRLLKQPRVNAEYYPEPLVSKIINPLSQSEYSKKQNEFIQFADIRDQVSDRMNRLNDLFPDFSIDCALETEKGGVNISTKDCHSGLIKLETALADRVIKTAKYNEIRIIGSFFSQGLSDSILNIKYSASASAMGQVLTANTEDFDTILKEVEEINLNTVDHY